MIFFAIFAKIKIYMKTILTIILLSCSTLSIFAGVNPSWLKPDETANFGIRPERPEVIDNQNVYNNQANSKLRKLGKRSTATLKCEGSPLVPVVLVQFPDKKFSTISQDSVNIKYDYFLNGIDSCEYYTGAGSCGSVRDYFRDQSYGKFTPKFVPIGPITLDSSYVYYGRNTTSNKDVNLNVFFKESIQKAQELIQGHDWYIFDNDENGIIDLAFFIYAGQGENDSSKNPDKNTIWPKEINAGGSIGGIQYGTYACCNEEFRGKLAGIGVLCHEFSHALGLPDLYDTDSKNYGLDYWDLMDSGCYAKDEKCPCGYSAYEKNFMGWRELIELTPDTPQDLTLYPMTDSLGFGYKITNQENPDEYYILENRQNVLWDSYIGYSTTTYGLHHGMLVTHIDYDETAWTRNRVNNVAAHQRCTLIPADGTLQSSMFAGTSTGKLYPWDEYFFSLGGDPFPGIAYDIKDKGIHFEPIDSLTGKMAKVFTRTGKTPEQMNQPITNIIEHANGVITCSYCGKKNDVQVSFFVLGEDYGNVTINGQTAKHDEVFNIKYRDDVSVKIEPNENAHISYVAINGEVKTDSIGIEDLFLEYLDKDAFIEITFDQPDAVEKTKAVKNNQSEQIFDLAGRRYYKQEKTLPKGIYIKNGQKIVIK